jgi:regulator of cell morphogenesis and NO signaling
MNVTQPVGQIAAESLAAVRVFEDHGIDYCCGGAKPLQEACAERGLDASALLAEVDQAKQSATADRDWSTAPAGELIQHILSTHHEYLRRELPRLAQRMDAVVKAHGDAHPRIVHPLAHTLAGLSAELEQHMRKEEMILFPFMERGGPAPFGSVANPIRVMEHEHDSAGQALAEMRRVTDGFTLPEGACNTFRALYAGLEELERDLHMHIHLENNILFPKALAAERGA